MAHYTTPARYITTLLCTTHWWWMRLKMRLWWDLYSVCMATPPTTEAHSTVLVPTLSAKHYLLRSIDSIVDTRYTGPTRHVTVRAWGVNTEVKLATGWCLSSSSDRTHAARTLIARLVSQGNTLHNVVITTLWTSHLGWTVHTTGTAGGRLGLVIRISWNKRRINIRVLCWWGRGPN